MEYDIAISSTIGSSHQKLFYNNQDAYSFYQDKNLICGVVADGCGSGTNSEVGAALGVDFVMNFCKRHFSKSAFDVDALNQAIINYLRNIIRNQQTKEEQEFTENYLFFTLFGFVISPQKTHIFHSGDGVYILNDQKVVIEQNNRPQYIAKNLIGGETTMETTHIETSKLNKLLIATDGLLHLDDKLENGEKIGNLSKIEDLFEQNSYFDNEVALPKFMIDLAIDKNIIKDDTTLIMLKSPMDK